MRVAIVGTRGIPASYSGFETSVQETAVRFVRAGIETIVYCRQKQSAESPAEYQGVKLRYLPSFKTKHLETITHTTLSVLSTVFSKVDAVILYGLGNSIFLLVYRAFSIPVVAVVDGADWERMKWGRFAKWYLRMNRRFAVRLSSSYVVDNELLCSRYREEFGRAPAYIPYGANSTFEYSREPLVRWRLEAKKYIIFVGRFVKEKGIDFLISNFEKTPTETKLVIVGGNDTDKAYETSLRETKDPRIIFTGFLYGNEYESLLRDALFYVSCSLLEGTSPSLLSAMTVNGFALVSDLDENREVLKGTCGVFKAGNGEDFQKKLLHFLSNEPLIEKERSRTRSVVEKYYSWDKITDQYVDLLKMAIGKNH